MAGGVCGRGACMAGGTYGGGACMAGGVWQAACMAGGRTWQGRHGWQERRPLKRVVRILLECILIFLIKSAQMKISQNGKENE